MKKSFLTTLAMLSVGVLLAKDKPTSEKQLLSSKKTSYSFMENKGQIVDQNQRTNTSVLYQLSLPGMNVSLKKDGFSYDTWKSEDLGENKNLSFFSNSRDKQTPHKFNYKFHRIDVNFIGANKNCELQSQGKSLDYNMYYSNEIGTKVQQFEKVLYKNLYPGIDLEFVANPVSDKPVEYNFIIAPGADVSLIKMQYSGSLESALKNGLIVMKLAHTSLSESIPASWYKESNRKVDVQYKVINQDKNSITVGFNVLNPKINSTLIIDPTPSLDWGSYYGDSGEDYGLGITTDPSGNLIMTGYTSGTSAIATTGAHQSTFGGGNFDAYLVKFNASGVRQWATYFGGTGDETGYALATDATGNIAVTGSSTSSSGIATAGAHQTVNIGGGPDAFVVKFNASGVRQWGTYYGAMLGIDAGSQITIDGSDNILVAGITTSSSAISTGGAHQTSNGGGYDAFLVKFNSSGVRQWATYYGGTGYEEGRGVVTDNANNVYFVGRTESASSIATAGSHQTTIGGGFDAFMVKFNASGVRQWGTYFGGTDYEESRSLLLDAAGSLLVTGWTSSSTGIATIGSHQETLGSVGFTDAFIAKFNTSGVRQWSTYYGGTDNEYAYDITSDANNNIFMAGRASSSNAIATLGSQQETISSAGYSDVMVVKFNASGVRQWGTYYGGASDDRANGLVVDASGNVFIAGTTSSNSSLSTTGAHQINYGGGATDAFIAKLAPCSTPATPTIVSNSPVCTGGTLTLTTPSVAGATYSWSGPNGFSSTNQNPTITSANSNTVGNYSVTISVSGCSATSNPSAVVVKSLPTSLKIKLATLSTVCDPNTVQFIVNPDASSVYGFNFQWNLNGSPITGATDTAYTASGAGGGAVTLTISGSTCSKTSSAKNYNILPLPTASFSAAGSTSICAGQSVTLTAPTITGYTYTWLRNGVSAGGGVTRDFKNAGVYTVVAKLNGCTDTSSNSVTIVVNPLPVATVTALTPSTFCAGDSCTMQASPSGGLNYAWINGTNTTNTSSNIFVTTIAGTNKVIVTDANGCVSVVSTINVKTKVRVVPVPTIVVNNTVIVGSSGSVKLKATPMSGMTFQWYLNGSPIANATNYQYIATVPGDYTVTISRFGCTNISLPTTITQTTVKETVALTSENSHSLNESFEMVAYPNPVSEMLTINIRGIETVNALIQVMDFNGRIVLTKEISDSNINLDLSKFAAGMYLVRYKDNEGRAATLKVIKE